MDQASFSDKPYTVTLRDVRESLLEMEKEAEKISPLGLKAPKNLICESQNNLIMRHLLILFRGKEMRKYIKKVGENLSFILIQPNGLLSFIKATCDLDETSQKSTTFNQRFQALCTVIIDLPGLCCSFEEYFERLASQTISLLITSEIDDRHEKPWKLAAFLITALFKKNQTLGQRFLLKPLIDGIQCKNFSLSVNDCLISIHHLVVCDFQKALFIPIFPNLLFIAIHLMTSISPSKSISLEIVVDMLKFVENSKYLLDHALCDFSLYFPMYCLGVVKHGQQNVLSVVAEKNPNSDIIGLKSIDKIVQDTLTILSYLDELYSIDFFLLIFSKTNISTRNKLLFYSLFDSLQQQLSSSILEYPSKAIQFISLYLKRLSRQNFANIRETIEESDGLNVEEVKKEIDIIQFDSFSGILQIISLLLEEKEKLKKQEIISLKETKVDLQLFTKMQEISDEEKLRCSCLCTELDALQATKSEDGPTKSNPYEEAIRCLNSTFMPTRAHGLVSLRRLIECRHESISKNKKQVLTLIEACTRDQESYVYVAAVNALASLALAYTEYCLPTLVKSFQDKQRTIEERVLVGEALVWVMKYLGDLSHHYSKEVINCFLLGLKDQDESIRVSSISNLGQFSASLHFSLGYYIVEIISATQSLLQTDPSLNVKRACLMFVHILLSGINQECITVIMNHLKSIYHLIKGIDSRSLDDPIVRLHAHLALEQIDEKVRDILRPSTDSITPIKIK